MSSSSSTRIHRGDGCSRTNSNGGGFMASKSSLNMKNRNSCNYNKNHRINLNIKLLYAVWCVVTLSSGSQWIAAPVQGAAVYSNANFLANPNFEPLCRLQQEQFIESDGKESSLMLEFDSSATAEATTTTTSMPLPHFDNDGNEQGQPQPEPQLPPSHHKKSCTRILSAPSGYGFIVRLILPKLRRGRHANAVRDLSSSETEELVVAATTLDKMSSLIEKLNTTALKSALGRTCPLSIFSSLDPHIPQWRVDPCQLEDTAPEMEDPVRLFHGRVRIVWEHNNHKLNSKLMVTVLGKGDLCRSEKKHQCLKIGDEPILCISKDLACDGIRHCPYSNEYDSDEDYAMCWKRRRFGEPIPPAMESDIFEHFALEVFRSLFAFDTSSLPVSTNTNSTTLRKVNPTLTSPPAEVATVNGTAAGNATMSNSTTPTMESTTEKGHNRRNSTRSGLSSDLSKYGPWGYLMLGMLLCGGALLICGLWASASQHAANNERESALQNSALNASQASNGAPPNYEELDPPPAYSVLFPNQKAASSATLNSLATTTTPAAPNQAPTLTTPSPAPVVAATSAASLAAATATATATTTAAAAAVVAAASSTPTGGNHRTQRDMPTLLITNAQ